MGISYHGESVTCKKCRRCISGVTEEEWMETERIGCQYCNKANWPKFYAKFNSKVGKWRIFKEDWAKITPKWWEFWRRGEELSEEIVTRYVHNIDGAGHDANIPIEFEKYSESKDYIDKYLKIG